MFSARLRGDGAAARWLRGLGVAAPHHLASLFQQRDLDGGITLLKLGDEMGLEDSDDLTRAEGDLYDLIAFAREESAAANDAAAKQPPWVYNSRKVAKERAAKRAEANKVIGKGKYDLKQVRPPAPAKARYGSRGRRIAGSGRPHARAEAEAAERERWVSEIVGEMRSLEAPSWQRLEGSLDAAKLMRLQIGGAPGQHAPRAAPGVAQVQDMAPRTKADRLPDEGHGPGGLSGRSGGGAVHQEHLDGIPRLAPVRRKRWGIWHRVDRGRDLPELLWRAGVPSDGTDRRRTYTTCCSTDGEDDGDDGGDGCG